MELCQAKTIKQGKLIFWKGSQKHLLSKGFPQAPIPSTWGEGS